MPVFYRAAAFIQIAWAQPHLWVVVLSPTKSSSLSSFQRTVKKEDLAGAAQYGLMAVLSGLNTSLPIGYS